jgi:hypothetical protein
LNRASKSKEDKEQILLKLFELLEGFTGRSIGKRFRLDEVCKAKQEIIKAIVDRADM